MQCLSSDLSSSIQQCQALSARRASLCRDQQALAPYSTGSLHLSAQRPASRISKCLPTDLQTRSSRAVHCHAIAPRTSKLDSSMIWGDIMILTATELASERLPKHITGLLTLTLIAAWIGVRMRSVLLLSTLLYACMAEGIQPYCRLLLQRVTTQQSLARTMDFSMCMACCLAWSKRPSPG